MTAAEYKVDGAYKICVTGDWGVGKSSMVLRYVDDAFVDEHQKTLGVEFKNKVIDIDGRQIKLRICDTAGQERFKTITASYYRSTHGVVFVYDITDDESLQNLTHWLDEVQRYANEGVNKIIVANKIDLLNDNPSNKSELEERINSGKSLAEKEGIKFYATSAKTGEKIQEVFQQIAKDVNQRITNQIAESNGPAYNNGTMKKRVKLDGKEKQKGKSKC